MIRLCCVNVCVNSIFCVVNIYDCYVNIIVMYMMHLDCVAYFWHWQRFKFTQLWLFSGWCFIVSDLSVYLLCFLFIVITDPNSSKLSIENCATIFADSIRCCVLLLSSLSFTQFSIQSHIRCAQSIEKNAINVQSISMVCFFVLCFNWIWWHQMESIPIIDWKRQRRKLNQRVIFV